MKSPSKVTASKSIDASVIEELKKAAKNSNKSKQDNTSKK